MSQAGKIYPNIINNYNLKYIKTEQIARTQQKIQ